MAGQYVDANLAARRRVLPMLEVLRITSPALVADLELLIGPLNESCKYENCGKPVALLACGREMYSESIASHPVPQLYCQEHASAVADESNPEYIDQCPNCGCMFGVN